MMGPWNERGLLTIPELTVMPTNRKHPTDTPARNVPTDAGDAEYEYTWW
jgi:hypothetical protein